MTHGSHNALRLTGQFNSSGLSKAVTRYVVIHCIVADADAELNRSYIARLRKSFGDGQGTKRVMIVNQSSSNGNRSHLTINVVVGSNQFLFDSRRERHYFERRTRFVSVFKGPIASCQWLGVTEVIRIERWRIR